MLIETRSGNTARPGKGWSGWAKPRRARGSGGGSRSAKIASPSGRYFQFRVGFRGDSGAVVRGVRYYYLPQNRATKITSIKVGGASARTGVTLGRGVTKSRSPVLKLSWGASNPDRDTTHYKLAVRREGEVLWRTINTGARPLSTTRFSWNTEAFPDGYYRLRVTSSDRPSNSGDRALTASKTSRLFLVDNGKPRVSAITVRYPQVSARGVDAMSAIHEMAFAVDDGPWMLGGAADGIFDDPVEMLRIKLPSGLKRGVHTLSIRVADEAGNVGSTSVSFRVR